MRAFRLFVAISCVCASMFITAGCTRQESTAIDRATAADGGRTSANAGGVAILDLDTVAKRFGCDKQMSISIQQREASLKKQLAAIESSYARQIVEKRQTFGDSPTPEQLKMLADIQQQAKASLNKVRQQATTNLNQHGSLLIQDFRRQLQPIARKVACEKGLSIIVTKNDSVIFDYDTNVDITQDVIDRLVVLRAQQSQSQQTPSQETAETTPAAPATVRQNPTAQRYSDSSQSKAVRATDRMR